MHVIDTTLDEIYLTLLEPSTEHTAQSRIRSHEVLIGEDDTGTIPSLADEIVKELLSRIGTDPTLSLYNPKNFPNGEAFDDTAGPIHSQIFRLSVAHLFARSPVLGLVDSLVHRNFISSLESQYDPALPFSSALHAASVAHQFEVFSNLLRLSASVSDPHKYELVHLGCLLASLGHCTRFRCPIVIAEAKRNRVTLSGGKRDEVDPLNSPADVIFGYQRPNGHLSAMALKRMMSNPEANILKDLCPADCDFLQHQVVSISLDFERKTRLALKEHDTSISFCYESLKNYSHIRQLVVLCDYHYIPLAENDQAIWRHAIALELDTVGNIIPIGRAKQNIQRPLNVDFEAFTILPLYQNLERILPPEDEERRSILDMWIS